MLSGSDARVPSVDTYVVLQVEEIAPLEFHFSQGEVFRCRLKWARFFLTATTKPISGAFPLLQAHVGTG